jgi:hypothetical protein
VFQNKRQDRQDAISLLLVDSLSSSDTTDIIQGHLTHIHVIGVFPLKTVFFSALGTHFRLNLSRGYDCWLMHRLALKDGGVDIRDAALWRY